MPSGVYWGHNRSLDSAVQAIPSAYYLPGVRCALPITFESKESRYCWASLFGFAFIKDEAFTVTGVLSFISSNMTHFLTCRMEKCNSCCTCAYSLCLVWICAQSVYSLYNPGCAPYVHNQISVAADMNSVPNLIPLCFTLICSSFKS